LVEDKADKSKQYAVKAFNKEYIRKTDKGYDSLINEIKILKLLNHPSLLKLEEI